jgi:hypothetical protein
MTDCPARVYCHILDSSWIIGYLLPRASAATPELPTSGFKPQVQPYLHTKKTSFDGLHSHDSGLLTGRLQDQRFSGPVRHVQSSAWQSWDGEIVMSVLFKCNRVGRASRRPAGFDQSIKPIVLKAELHGIPMSTST